MCDTKNNNNQIDIRDCNSNNTTTLIVNDCNGSSNVDGTIKKVAIKDVSKSTVRYIKCLKPGNRGYLAKLVRLSTATVTRLIQGIGVISLPKAKRIAKVTNSELVIWTNLGHYTERMEAYKTWQMNTKFLSKKKKITRTKPNKVTKKLSSSKILGSSTGNDKSDPDFLSQVNNDKKNLTIKNHYKKTNQIFFNLIYKNLIAEREKTNKDGSNIAKTEEDQVKETEGQANCPVDNCPVEETKKYRRIVSNLKHVRIPTKSHLARELNVSKSYISEIISNKLNARSDYADKLACILNTSSRIWLTEGHPLARKQAFISWTDRIKQEYKSHVKGKFKGKFKIIKTGSIESLAYQAGLPLDTFRKIYKGKENARLSESIRLGELTETVADLWTSESKDKARLQAVQNWFNKHNKLGIDNETSNPEIIRKNQPGSKGHLAFLIGTDVEILKLILAGLAEADFKQARRLAILTNSNKKLWQGFGQDQGRKKAFTIWSTDEKPAKIKSDKVIKLRDIGTYKHLAIETSRKEPYIRYLCTRLEPLSPKIAALLSKITESDIDIWLDKDKHEEKKKAVKAWQEKVKTQAGIIF
jgi:plasmid maintenance system antidote protein VapI